MKKETVLIVEDDPQMVGVISYAFQVAEFETLIAFNAHQALDHMQNYRVDLVVLDVMLPGQSGLELCRQIRGHTDVPILMLTAKSDQADVIVPALVTTIYLMEAAQISELYVPGVGIKESLILNHFKKL